MYSISPIYGNKSFDSRNVMSSIYPMKAYYHDICDGDNQQLIPLPSRILPIPSDLDFEKDPDSRMVLEDLLSRQMLLLCRLNDLERDLIEANDIKVSTKPINFTKIMIGDLKHEDIVVHFSIDHPPLTLLTVLSLMARESPSSLLVNYHVHSSLHDNSVQLQLKQKNLDEKIRRINFHFNTVVDNTHRADRQFILTFIAKKQLQDCYAIFKSNQPQIVGELNIVRKLCLLISNMETSPESEELWNILLESDLTSDLVCIEKIGRYLVGLDDKQFLFSQTEPGILDVVLWSLVNSDITDDKSRALRSLMDPKWSKVIASLVV